MPNSKTNRKSPGRGEPPPAGDRRPRRRTVSLHRLVDQADQAEPDAPPKASRRRSTCIDPGFLGPDAPPFNPSMRVLDDRDPPVERYPLSERAEKLLADYYRRRSFHAAVRDGAPVEWAAQTLLGVQRRQGHTIQVELHKHQGSVGWLRHQAWEGIRLGKIHPGRLTLPSDLARAFFSNLAGHRFVHDYRNAFEHRMRVDISEAHRVCADPIDREIVDYFVWSNMLWGEGR